MKASGLGMTCRRYPAPVLSHAQIKKMDVWAGDK